MTLARLCAHHFWLEDGELPLNAGRLAGAPVRSSTWSAPGHAGGAGMTGVMMEAPDRFARS